MRLFAYSASFSLFLPHVFWRRAVKCLPTLSPFLPLDNNFPGYHPEGTPCGRFIRWLHGQHPARGGPSASPGHAGVQPWRCSSGRDSAQAGGAAAGQGWLSPASTDQPVPGLSGTKERTGPCRGAGDAVLCLRCSGTGRATPHSHHGTAGCS